MKRLACVMYSSPVLTRPPVLNLCHLLGHWVTIFCSVVHFLQPTGTCEALFDFTAENSGELTFTAGEVIETTDWVNEEWLSGRIGTREGIFPLGFVKVLVELPKPSTTQSSVQKGEWSGGQAELSVWFRNWNCTITDCFYTLDFDRSRD